MNWNWNLLNLTPSVPDFTKAPVGWTAANPQQSFPEEWRLEPQTRTTSEIGSSPCTSQCDDGQVSTNSWPCIVCFRRLDVGQNRTDLWNSSWIPGSVGKGPGVGAGSPSSQAEATPGSIESQALLMKQVKSGVAPSENLRPPRTPTPTLCKCSKSLSVVKKTHWLFC